MTFRIPLIDRPRQSLIVRLGDVDCRLSVWWQPSDGSWWAGLEAPVNTPVVRSRRLAVDTGVLDRISGVLPGNIRMRCLGEPVTEATRSGFRDNTHALVWEPD